MVKINFEDIMIWIFILFIIGTALWLLHGSPPESSALITIALFVAGSDLLIWKKIFNIEKKTSIGFMKIKHEIEKDNLMMNNRFDKIEDKLNIINNKLKR